MKEDNDYKNFAYYLYSRCVTEKELDKMRLKERLAFKCIVQGIKDKNNINNYNSSEEMQQQGGRTRSKKKQIAKNNYMKFITHIYSKCEFEQDKEEIHEKEMLAFNCIMKDAVNTDNWADTEDIDQIYIRFMGVIEPISQPIPKMEKQKDEYNYDYGDQMD